MVLTAMSYGTRLRSLSIKPYRLNFLLICLFFSALALLITQTIAHLGSIIDGWVLDGILFYFVLYVLVYSVNAIFLPDLKQVAIVTSVFLSAINLIPNLKYDFILGFEDPLWHYSFINAITDSGHVPNFGVYKDQYGATFGLQSLVSSLSQVTGLNTIAAMKIFLTVAPAIIPLISYFLLKRIKVQEDLARLVIVSSAIITPAMYIYTGTNSAFFLFVFFVFLFLLYSVEKRDAKVLIIALIIGIAVVFSHDFTSFFLIISMLTILILKVIGNYLDLSRLKSFSNVSTFLVVFFLVFALGHLTLGSTTNFVTIMSNVGNLLKSIIIPRGLPSIGFYSGFYELAIVGKIQVLAVRLGQGLTVIGLILIAPLAIAKTPTGNKNLQTVYIVATIPLTVGLLVFLMPFLIRETIDFRGLNYAAGVAPLFAGTSLYYILFSRRARKLRKTFATFLVFFLILLEIAQTYVWQPIIPSQMTEVGKLYVVDWRQVNTIYSRSMILFVSTFDSSLGIETDVSTRSQILGLTDSRTQSLLTKVQNGSNHLYLLSRVGLGQEIASLRYAVFDEQLLRTAIQSSSIIYDNGGCYIALNATMPGPI